MRMKKVRYTVDALKDLRRHGNMRDRLRKAIDEYASSGAHTNNVEPLVGVPGSRMRVGDFRIIFEETDTEIIVTKVGPRGDVYR
jgi:mRNA interferase RelE/StbE